MAAGPAAAERAARKAFQAGESAKAVALLVQAADAFRAARRTRDEMRVLDALVNIYARSGEADKQIAALLREVEIATGKADRSGAAALYAAVGDAYGCLDDPRVCAAAERRASAVDAYKKSAVVSIAAGDRTAAGAVLLKAATVARIGGGSVEPAALLDQAEEVSAGIEDQGSRLTQQTAVGHARLLAGDAGRGVAILRKVVDAADAANLPWAAADAEGLLGWAATEAHDSDAAFEHTKLALRRAGERGNPGDLYPWEWQLARLYRAAGNRKEAAREYAVAAAMAERTAVPASPAAHGPGTAGASDIFLDYAGFLTELAQTETGEERQQLLRQARTALLSRRRRQLSEYYGGDCFKRSGADSASSTELDAASPKTLVLYPMFLPERVVLLTSRNDTLDTLTVAAPAAQVRGQLDNLRQLLEKRTTLEYRGPAQALYDELIRPLEKDVDLHSLDALVVVPDGPLHRVPIAALYDGRRHEFLIQLVPVATAPGFNLPAGSAPARFSGTIDGAVLAAGLSKAKPGKEFADLPEVRGELTDVGGRFRRSSQLLDSRFEVDRLTSEYQHRTFRVVHIASHARFNRSAQTSTILTNGRDLEVNQLDFFLQNGNSGAVLDLLVLSACDTAEGDDRAGLGLGGVAIQAGARTALATLWHIDDTATHRLMKEFYDNLYTTSKAKALQLAQKRLLEDRWFRHPGYWAPFLLINDWR